MRNSSVPSVVELFWRPVTFGCCSAVPPLISMIRCALLLPILTALAVAATPGHDRSSLVIVIDGLRPDYVTKEIMPNLDAFGEKGVRGEVHHAVFPTVTRVNSA